MQLLPLLLGQMDVLVQVFSCLKKPTVKTRENCNVYFFIRSLAIVLTVAAVWVNVV